MSVCVCVCTHTCVWERETDLRYSRHIDKVELCLMLYQCPCLIHTANKDVVLKQLHQICIITDSLKNTKTSTISLPLCILAFTDCCKLFTLVKVTSFLLIFLLNGCSKDAAAARFFPLMLGADAPPSTTSIDSSTSFSFSSCPLDTELPPAPSITSIDCGGSCCSLRDFGMRNASNFCSFESVLTIW